jgi:hypothetical protein
MENLTERVYECTLAVEAHMICDLLARAGISARVDGEFLGGVGGELPLGSTIKVRVEPARAAEAREVSDEWERLQPPEPTPMPPPRRSSWRSPLWFLGGVLAGGAVVFLALRTPYTQQSADLDGDGVNDEFYFYSGELLDHVDYDRNSDGRMDARWTNDSRGVAVRLDSDDDFDGRFEWEFHAERGWVTRGVMDADADGRPERVQLFKNGVLHTVEVYGGDGTRVVVREHIDNSRLVASEYDDDGDGAFERRVEYDRLGQPLARTHR